MPMMPMQQSPQSPPTIQQSVPVAPPMPLSTPTAPLAVTPQPQSQYNMAVPSMPSQMPSIPSAYQSSPPQQQQSQPMPFQAFPSASSLTPTPLGSSSLAPSMNSPPVQPGPPAPSVPMPPRPTGIAMTPGGESSGAAAATSQESLATRRSIGFYNDPPMVAPRAPSATMAPLSTSPSHPLSPTPHPQPMTQQLPVPTGTLSAGSSQDGKTIHHSD